jgi:hypothetical protein
VSREAAGRGWKGQECNAPPISAHPSSLFVFVQFAELALVVVLLTVDLNFKRFCVFGQE